MSTPSSVPPARDEEVAKHLLTARRHSKGLDVALQDLERAIMGKPTATEEQSEAKK